jgi:hypothetical protein
MYMFEDFFMLQVLKRYNEVICYEDITPFRVISMATGAGADGATPFMNLNGGLWTNAVQSMVHEHRRDPASYHTFPFPMNYQQLGGQAKELAPVEIMEKAKADILAAWNIPQELYNMSLQTQAVGPALRLFENSWSMLPNYYNQLLQHIGDVIGAIKGLPPAKISLIPVTFADDMERKSVVGQLVSANAIARSELLKLYGFDYKEQIRKKMQEDKDQQDLAKEEQEKAELEASSEANIFNQRQQSGEGQQPSSGGGGTPQDVLQKAQEIAQQLMPQDGAARRAELQKIKATDQTLYSAVKAQLEQLTSNAKSQGVQSARQSQQQSGAR